MESDNSVVMPEESSQDSRMRTVYRYEDRKGVGPYRSSTWLDYEAHSTMCEDHAGDHHPTWLTDGMTAAYYGNGRWKAAFNSRESLDAWFEGWHETLEANGFCVREYKVPIGDVETSISGAQVAFYFPL